MKLHLPIPYTANHITHTHTHHITHLHTYVYIYIHLLTLTPHSHTPSHTYTHTHSHARAHAHTHTHTHTHNTQHTSTHTHTHTCTCNSKLVDDFGVSHCHGDWIGGKAPVISLVLLCCSSDVEITRGKERKPRVTCNVQSNVISLPVYDSRWPGGRHITHQSSCTVHNNGYYLSH